MKSYQKKYLFFFQTGGRAPGAPVLDPPLQALLWITQQAQTEVKGPLQCNTPI